MIKMKPNSFGINPVSPEFPPGFSIPNAGLESVDLDMEHGVNSSKLPPEVPIKVDVAVKTSVDIFVF
jgi:hypothetical protein